MRSEGVEPSRHMSHQRFLNLFCNDVPYHSGTSAILKQKEIEYFDICYLIFDIINLYSKKYFIKHLSHNRNFILLTTTESFI